MINSPRTTNQAVILVCVQNGKRVAIPVGAPAVYEKSDGEDEVIGGSAPELADAVIDCIINKMVMNSHMLPYIVGKNIILYSSLEKIKCSFSISINFLLKFCC